MDEHERFMALAIAEARTAVARKRGAPFGAVIVRDGRMVVAAGNESLVRSTPTAHAELMAINQACGALGVSALPGCTIYASGQPCPMCLAAIHSVGINRLYYATTYAQAAVLGYDPEPFVSAICGSFGARGQDEKSFYSTALLEVVHLPMPEADSLLS